MNKNEIPEKTMMEAIKDYLNTNIYTENSIVLDSYSATLPSLCLRQVGIIEKKNCTILGEFTGTMNYQLSVRLAKESEPLLAYQILEKLPLYLHTANQNHVYPNLGLSIQCLRIAITSNPVFKQFNEDYSADYALTFTMTFHKQQNIYM